MKSTIDRKAKELNTKAEQTVENRKRRMQETREEVQKSIALKQGFSN